MRIPSIIYMDQFLWIELARCHLNPDENQTGVAATEALLCAIESGEAVCPLSATHALEVGQRMSIESRRKLLSVMVSFSRGWFLAPEVSLMPQEIRHSLARVFGTRTPPPIEYLGRGVPFGFGRSGCLSQDLDMTGHEAEVFEAMLDSPQAVFHLLGGTSNEFIEPTRTMIREHYAKVSEEEEQHREISKSFDDAMRKRAHAAKLTIALQDHLIAALSEIGRSMEDLLGLGCDGLMDFWHSIPTADVEIELATRCEKQWSRPIAPNDTNDITFLSTAIPYCDLVLTEAFWTQLASQCQLPEKYATKMGSKLHALTEFLEGADSSEVPGA